MTTAFKEDLRTDLASIKAKTLHVYISSATTFDNVPTMFNVNVVSEGTTLFSFTDKYFNQTKISAFRYVLRKLINFLNKAKKVGEVHIHVSDIGILTYLTGLFPYYQSTQSLTKYNNEINGILEIAKFPVTIHKFSGRASYAFKVHIAEADLDYANLNNTTLEKAGLKFDLWWKDRVLFRRNTQLWKTVELTQE